MKQLQIISVKKTIDNIIKIFSQLQGRFSSALIRDRYPEVKLIVKKKVIEPEKEKIIAEGKIVSFGKAKKRFEGWPLRTVYRYVSA